MQYEESQLVKNDGSLTESDGETAEVLNNFFQLVFTSECCHAINTLPNSVSQLSHIFY